MKKQFKKANFNPISPFWSMITVILWILAVIFSLPSASCAVKADEVLVTANKRKITVQDFIDFHRTRPRIARWNSEKGNQNDPNETLNALIGKVLMAEEAYRLYPDGLKNHTQEIADFEQGMLINVFTEEQIDKGIVISEQEVDQRVPENQKFEVHLRRIVVFSEEEALKLKKQLEKGADFVTMAKKFSQGEEAHKGGDIGYMSFDQGIFPKKVVEEIFALKDGRITGPASIREGYALFQVLGKRKVKGEDLERVRQYIRQQISLERKKERWNQLLQQLYTEFRVVINEDLFKEIEQAISRNQGAQALKRMSGLEIAKVRDHSIRLGEIIPDGQDPSYGGGSPWEKDAQVLRRILDRKVKAVLVSDYARKLHYDQSGEVKKNIARFKDDLMVRRLVAEGIYKDLSVSLEECRQYYQAHLPEYRVPERVKISRITTSDEKTAAEVVLKLQKGIHFNELSKQYPSSDSLTPKGFWARGGSTMGKEFEEQVFHLRTGQVSDPIKTEKGVHIVKLLERQKEGFAQLSEVESHIRETLLSMKKEKALSDHIAGLRKKSKVVINKILFQEVTQNAL
ncbi:MAG: peptidyl-prolyl cis-trans isomerase [bacterium]